MEEKKDNGVIKYVRQPWPMTTITRSLTLQETHIFAELMDIIGDRVTALFNNREENTVNGQLNLFKEEDFTEDGVAYIDLPLRTLTNRADCYADIEAVAEKLKDSNIKWNETNEEEILEHNMNLFVDTITVRDKKTNRRTGVIRFVISKYQARYFFNFARYSRYIKAVVRNCKSVYTARLYMIITANRNFGKWSTSYSELRRILGCTIFDEETKEWKEYRYKDYKNFKFKTLKVAEQELKELAEKGEVDCYFDFEEDFGDQKMTLSNNPQKILFTIHKTAIAELENTSKDNVKYSDVNANLCSLFGFTSQEADKILSEVDEDKLDMLRRRATEISEIIEGQGNRIKNKKAYAIKSLKEAINSFVPIVEEYKDAKAKENDKDEEVHKTPEFIKPSNEDIERFNKTFFEGLDKMWKQAFSLLSIDEDNVYINSPQRGSLKFFIEQNGQEPFQRVQKEFGKNVKLNYTE